MSFGTAGTVADGGATHKGWRVLGVGSIPSVTLGASGYQSQSTKVLENGAYILAEDQTGTNTYLGGINYWDYKSGATVVKNNLATYSTNFITAAGNFSTAERESLVSQQLPGVCNSSSGCTGSWGIQTSIESYTIYPISFGDYHGVATGGSGLDGKFFVGIANKSVQAGVITQSPAAYYTRSHADSYNYKGAQITTNDGTIGGTDADTTFGTRFAGVLNLESVPLYQVGQILT